MKNSSVGDFAEQLLAQERSNHGVTPPVPAAPAASQGVGGPMPDISQVNVPADFVGSLVEGVQPSSPSDSPPTPEAVTPIVEDITEFKVLIQEVRDLLVEVKQTLTEMTSAGMLGVGASTEEKKKKKDEDDLTNLLRKVRQKRASK